MKLLYGLLTLALLVGCGASKESVTPADDAAAEMVAPQMADASGANDVPGNGDIAFKDLAFGERKAFMNDVVMPEMKPLFVEEHPDFSCISCHGENMTEVNFEMPNTLVPLNPAAMPFASEDEKVRAAATFMKETVVPKMAGLLKEPPYNTETKSGFGCFNCHATAQ
ncbi:MAG: hypothetical protein JXR76_14900 [Deltaproteobacteria bacterium]|nr:hypothetical protein [Deltaproteobacteria bacterium]